MDQEAPGSMETSGDTAGRAVPFAPYKPRRLLTIDNWKPGLSTLFVLLLSVSGFLLLPISWFVSTIAKYQPLTSLLPMDVFLFAQSLWTWFFSLFHSSEFLDVLLNSVLAMAIVYIRRFLFILPIVSLVLLLINALYKYWAQRSSPQSAALARTTRALINVKILDATLLLMSMVSVFTDFSYSIEDKIIWLPLGYLTIYIGSLFAAFLLQRKKRLHPA